MLEYINSYRESMPEEIEPVVTPIVPDRFAGRETSKENYEEANMIMYWLSRVDLRGIKPNTTLERIAINNPIPKYPTRVAPRPKPNTGYR